MSTTATKAPPTITTSDGTVIYYKDWGSGQPVVFSHGWPLNADAWDDQLFHVAANGFRAIAHDRRGHGRSSQPWEGNNLDTYADDLAELIEALDLRDVILVGHSTGGGEIVRYIGRHGNERVAKAVLVGAIAPLMLKTAANPGEHRWRRSTRSAPASWATARSSTRISRFRSTARTATARTSPTASYASSGGSG